jgi:hypothetical protein
MHYHLEAIIPPVKDLEKALESLLAEFNKNGKDEDGEANSHTFWDWYEVGGRWSGEHAKSLLDKDKFNAFEQELVDKKIQISGLRWGKPELASSSEIRIVKQLWLAYFPDAPIECPLFKNTTSAKCKYDVMPLVDLPKTFTCATFIVAQYPFNYEYKKNNLLLWTVGDSLKPNFLLQRQYWNGVNHQDTSWDGTVGHALELYEKDWSYSKGEEHVATNKMKSDWLAVTVDYHN